MKMKFEDKISKRLEGEKSSKYRNRKKTFIHSISCNVKISVNTVNISIGFDQIQIINTELWIKMNI